MQAQDSPAVSSPPLPQACRFGGERKVEEGGAWLGIPLTEECCQLLDVDLSENQMGAAGAQAICAAITVNPTVQKVRLAGNGLEEHAAQSLAELLLAHTGLKSLDLSYNQLNDHAGTIQPGPLWGPGAHLPGTGPGGGWQHHSEHSYSGSCFPCRTLAGRSPTLLPHRTLNPFPRLPLPATACAGC